MIRFEKKPFLNQGFTLIELMTSLVIVGILTTAAVQNYQQMRANARTVELYQHITTTDKNLMAYHLEYGTFLFLKNVSSDIAIPAMQSGASSFVVDGGEAGMRDAWRYGNSGLSPIGSRVNYYLVALAGKFLNNGAVAPNNLTWRGPVIRPGFLAYTTYGIGISENQQHASCTGQARVYEYYPTDFGAIPNPGRAYDWAQISAIARFGKTQYECYQFSRLLTYDSRSGDYKRSGFVNFH